MLNLTIDLPVVDTGPFSFGSRAASGGAGLEVARQRIKKAISPAYLPRLEDESRVQIFFGGSSSGKSVFNAQRVVYDLLGGERNYLICRAVAATLHDSIFKEVRGVIDEFDLNELFDIHETRKTITCISNRKQAIFKGLDKVEKVKSIRALDGPITDLLIEEATETQQSDIRQLLKRQRGGDGSVKKRLTLVFNPILRTHWIYKTYFANIGWTDDQTEHNDGRLSILKTWYIHNPHLTEDDVYDLENEPDKYMYEVYTLGNWGVLGNVIFKNYEVRDLSDVIPTFDRLNHGVDWGFGSDPYAFNSTYYDKTRKVLYILNEIHTGEASDEITAEMIRPFVENRTVICDSAEPKAIAKYRELGIRAVGAVKGPGSIETGYRWLRGIKIVVDKSCVKTIHELQVHSWKENKHGEPLPVPEDKNNHHIDEIRYQCEGYMLEGEIAARQAHVRGRAGSGRKVTTRR